MKNVNLTLRIFFFITSVFSGRKTQGEWDIPGILQLGVERKENTRILNSLGQAVWGNHLHMEE